MFKSGYILTVEPYPNGVRIGRNFYDKCGFIKMYEHPHEETGFMQIRLKLTY